MHRENFMAMLSRLHQLKVMRLLSRSSLRREQISMHGEDIMEMLSKLHHMEVVWLLSRSSLIRGQMSMHRRTLWKCSLRVTDSVLASTLVYSGTVPKGYGL
jgi:hypothetical protein